MADSEPVPASYYVPEGPNKGNIGDAGEAQLVASEENKARELEVKRKAEVETGLTNYERKNVVIMKGIQEKYPHACIEKLDSEGRWVLAFSSNANDRKSVDEGSALFGVSTPGLVNGSDLYLMAKQGLFRLSGCFVLKHLDLVKTMDSFEKSSAGGGFDVNGRKFIRDAGSLVGQKDEMNTVYLTQIDLGNGLGLSDIRNILAENEKAGIKVMEERGSKESAGKLSADEVLAKL